MKNNIIIPIMIPISYHGGSFHGTPEQDGWLFLALAGYLIYAELWLYFIVERDWNFDFCMFMAFVVPLIVLGIYLII